MLTAGEFTAPGLRRTLISMPQWRTWLLLHCTLDNARPLHTCMLRQHSADNLAAAYSIRPTEVSMLLHVFHSLNNVVFSGQEQASAVLGVSVEWKCCGAQQ
jgi:hypothetical protein